MLMSHVTDLRSHILWLCLHLFGWDSEDRFNSLMIRSSQLYCEGGLEGGLNAVSKPRHALHTGLPK